VTFWHYARRNRLSLILGTAGGLRARKRAFFSPELGRELDGLYTVVGFLDPKPNWLAGSP